MRTKKNHYKGSEYSISTKPVLIWFTLLLTSILAPIGEAGVILQPATATSSTGSTFGSVEERTINQSGLSTGYTSQTTDFDTYLATAPTHDSTGANNNYWFDSDSGTTANFDLSLGGTFTIESLALWNDQFNSAINSFTLLADDNAGFSSPTSLGNFNASQAGDITIVPVERFNFTATSATHVRIQINSVHGGTAMSIGEIAFNVSAVPEPSSTIFCSLALGAFLACRTFVVRRKERTN